MEPGDLMDPWLTNPESLSVGFEALNNTVVSPTLRARRLHHLNAGRCDRCTAVVKLMVLNQ